MYSLTLSLAELLGAGFVFVMISTAISYWCIVKSVAGLKAEFNLSQSRLENQIKVLTSGAVGLGKKIIFLEGKTNSLRDIQEEMKVSDIEFSYTQAQKLLEQGVDKQTIAANSGLSASEIQLMELLHNQSKQISAAQV